MSQADKNDLEQPPRRKVVFYDMKHSNNAARIRLWLRIKNMEHVVEAKLLTHEDIESDYYSELNPLKKVPCLVTDHGLKLFESYVIINYLEDRFGKFGPPTLVLETGPDDRAFVELLVRIHDVYIASPNCTQANFAHTQGCMYLDPHATEFTPSSRTMTVQVRAAKLAEIYKQLTWLEQQVRLPFMAGSSLTHADITWFPTTVFMELLLPLVFEWSEIFHESLVFPKLTTWFGTCMKEEHFQTTRNEIRDTLLEQSSRGRFAPVREEAKNHPEYKWKYM